MKLLVRLSLAFALLLSCLPLYAGGQPESAANSTNASAGSAGQPTETAKPAPNGLPVVKAFVSILPQVYFVKTIGADRVEVHALVPPGVEPETYDPTPRQLSMLSQARLYFAIGLPFEAPLVPKIRSVMKGVTVIDTQAGVPLRSFAQNSAGARAGRGGMDPHIWLAPLLVKIQGATIERALIAADPAGAHQYEAGLAKLDDQMDQLHRTIAATLAGLTGRSFFVFHPAFGYFAQEFGLKQVSIEEEGKSPGPRELVELIARAKKLDAKVIFVEPQFDQSRAEVIADSIGARVVTINPLAEDYVANLETVATRIKAALQ